MVGYQRRQAVLSAQLQQVHQAKRGKTWLDDTSKSAFPLARIADVLLHPGKKIQYNGTEITYPDIKAVYWAGGNPFVHHQDTNTLVKASET